MGVAARNVGDDDIHFMAYHTGWQKDVLLFPVSQNGGPACIILGPLLFPDSDEDCPIVTGHGEAPADATGASL